MCIGQKFSIRLLFLVDDFINFFVHVNVSGDGIGIVKFQFGQKCVPVETPRVGFPSRGDVAVPIDVLDIVSCPDIVYKPDELLILLWCGSYALGAHDLDADGVVVRCVRLGLAGSLLSPA